MNTAKAITSTGVMSEHDYERKRQEIDEEFKANALQGQNKSAIKDRELSKLFAKSGWTQQQLAEKESEITGKKVSQPQMAVRLRFGRFLQFITPCNKSEKDDIQIPIDLSEGKFRKYWEKTENGTHESIRFRRVAAMIEEDSEVVDSFCRFKRDKTEIPSAKVIEQFGDGKWHTIEDIAAYMEVSPEKMKERLSNWKTQGVGKCTYESRKYGKTKQFRIIKGGGRKVDLTALEKEIAPILKALDEEGGKNDTTMSPPTVLHLSNQLRKLIERLAR